VTSLKLERLKAFDIAIPEKTTEATFREIALKSGLIDTKEEFSGFMKTRTLETMLQSALAQKARKEQHHELELDI